MPAYLIAEIEVLDPAGYAEYIRLVPATIARYGGRYVARGSAVDALEGEPGPVRMAIVEFPDAARIREWHESPEYRPVRAIRLRTAKSRLRIIEGVA
jgi:uncharacterized protein (DUF1330 family)